MLVTSSCPLLKNPKVKVFWHRMCRERRKEGRRETGLRCWQAQDRSLVLVDCVGWSWAGADLRSLILGHHPHNTRARQLGNCFSEGHACQTNATLLNGSRMCRVSLLYRSIYHWSRRVVPVRQNLIEPHTSYSLGRTPVYLPALVLGDKIPIDPPLPTKKLCLKAQKVGPQHH